jgi:cytochrome P450
LAPEGTPSRRNARYTPLEVDGPLPVDMVRAVPSIRRDPIAFLARTTARYGDLVAFPMPGRAALLVNRPAAAWQILTAGERGWSKDTPQYTALAAITGRGLLTSDGPAWRERRRLAQPAYSHDSLEAVAQASKRAGRAVADQVPPGGGVIDVEQALLHATLDVVAEALFGSAGVAEGRRLVQAVLGALDVVVARVRTPLHLPDRLPTRGNRWVRRAVAALDEACAAVVAARRAEAGQRAQADLLGVLLAAFDSGTLSASGLRDELVTTVIAGHETVATSLAWTLDLLARHDDVQESVHAEIDAVGAMPAGDPTRLTYTRAVVDEALRLYPPAWVITRRATSDHDLDGVAVPSGTLVIVSPWLLHRGSAWTAPEVFAPSRFGADAPMPLRGTYLPFGAGPRLCIGRELALMESVVLLADLLSTHRVQPVGRNVPRRTKALVTLRPDGGLPLQVVPR